MDFPEASTQMTIFKEISKALKNNVQIPEVF